YRERERERENLTLATETDTQREELASLQKELTDVHILKFGRVVDLAKLDGLSLCPEAEAIREETERRQAGIVAEQAQFEAELKAAKVYIV
ncbi:hypothetical protein KIPB_016164, partial [Kipferlia bialata]